MLGTITIILEFYVQVNSSSRGEQNKDIFRESSRWEAVKKKKQKTIKAFTSVRRKLTPEERCEIQEPRMMKQY